ncbi:hypothetical protein ACN47E_000586 [Coniothyrium glycines]
MAAARRLLLITSSVLLLLLIALSLATAIELRTPPQKFIQITVAQAAKLRLSHDAVGAKAKLNGTGFDRGDVWHGTSLISGATALPTMVTATQEGLIGFTPSAPASASWSAEGVLGPVATPTASRAPAPRPPPAAQMPIVALSYAGSGGPKHCRGALVQQKVFAPPLDDWKNGTCINLPSEARCGVFFAGKNDNCEAHLFNMANCYNTSRTYVNTVVFMPEERPVGALWSSMFVRCGVAVPDVKMLDPSILGGALKRPGGGKPPG